MRAYCAIRPQPHYRREAFHAGLKAAGYDVRTGVPGNPGDCQVLVIWNRYDINHQLALMVEKAGGVVLVAENGYLNAGGGTPKFDVHEGVESGHYYALAKGGHNGSGTWPDRAGGHWIAETETYGARWRALGIELKAWRTAGKHILVCPNRSFGRPDLIMPPNWAADVERRLKSATKREVRVRPHPGNDRPARPLEADLEGAHAVVIWSSSAGVHALVHGIQVVCEGPAFILKGACARSVRDIDLLCLGEREPHFERLAWAQWTVDEIASGEPFRRLLA